MCGCVVNIYISFSSSSVRRGLCESWPVCSSWSSRTGFTSLLFSKSPTSRPHTPVLQGNKNQGIRCLQIWTQLNLLFSHGKRPIIHRYIQKSLLQLNLPMRSIMHPLCQFRWNSDELYRHLLTIYRVGEHCLFLFLKLNMSKPQNLNTMVQKITMMLWEWFTNGHFWEAAM